MTFIFQEQEGLSERKGVVKEYKRVRDQYGGLRAEWAGPKREWAGLATWAGQRRGGRSLEHRGRAFAKWERSLKTLERKRLAVIVKIGR